MIARCLERVAPAVAALLVAGCSASPPHAPLEATFETPPQWQAVEAAVGSAEVEWWREFEDPQLDAVVLEAIANNYDLAQAAARVAQAEAAARIAGAALYPELAGTFGGSRTKRNFIGFGDAFGGGDDGGGGGGQTVASTTNNTFNLGLDVSWELDVWGRIRAGRSAATGDAQASLIDRDAAELSLSGRVAKAWYGAIEAREQLALARQTVDSYESSTSSVRTRYERGVAPALDLRLALTELAGAHALVERRGRELDGAVRELEILLGRYPSRALEPKSRLATPAGTVPAGLPTQLLARRPDLVAAERRLAASGARVKEARAALFPRIALTASRGQSSEEISDLLENSFSVWSLAGNLTQPIFQGGALRAAVDQAEARQLEAAAAYAATALASYSEVETLLAAEGYLSNRESHLSEAATQSRAALDLATERYVAGLEDYVTLLASQRNTLNAESEHIAVRRARLDARIDLYLALGGGFSAGERFDFYPDGTREEDHATGRDDAVSTGASS